MSKQRTPDILNQMMDKSAQKPVAPSDHQATVTSANGPLAAYVSGDKVKTTIYTSADISDRLDTAQTQMKRYVAQEVGREKRTLVTKSLLVEIALHVILDEYEEAGTESHLAQQLATL